MNIKDKEGEDKNKNKQKIYSCNIKTYIYTQMQKSFFFQFFLFYWELGKIEQNL